MNRSRWHAGRCIAAVPFILFASRSYGAFAQAPAPDDPVASAPAPSPFEVGSRLTWQASDSTSEGYQLVPDSNGWFERDGQYYTVQTAGGSGGVGLDELNLVVADPAGLIAEVRQYLNTDLGTNAHVSAGTSLVVGDAAGLGVYWIPPARLAAMQSTEDGTTTVSRGPRQLGGQRFDTVGIRTVIAGHYETFGYDAATGLLLFSGSMTAASGGVTVLDQNGELLEQGRGAVTYTHKLFLGVRPLDIPWSSSPLPDWATAGQTIAYHGQVRNEPTPSAGLTPPPVPVTISHVFDQRLGDVVLGRQVTHWPMLQSSASDSQTARVYATSTFDSIWIAPAVLGQLQAGAVLDSDPLSGQTVTFGGVDSGVAVIVRAGTVDRLEQYYDTTSGILVSSRYSQAINNLGTQVTELALAAPG